MFFSHLYIQQFRTYISCGDQDGKLDKTAGYLSFAPLGDISDETNVVSQLSTLLTSNRIHQSNREKIEATYKELYDAGKPEKALKSALALMVSIAEFHTTNKVALTDTLRMPTPPDTKNETLTHPYRAIVSLNLFGGADTFSMLTPHPDGCSDLYNEYKIRRGASLTLQPSELFKIDASTSEQPCTSFGVNSILPSFKDMYNRKEGIFFANIGHMNKPVNRYNFQTETTAQLFSHEDMRVSMAIVFSCLVFLFNAHVTILCLLSLIFCRKNHLKSMHSIHLQILAY